MKRNISLLRLYIDRARGYISYVNFAMLLLVFLENVDVPVISVWYKEHTTVFLSVGVLFLVGILILIGWIDIKLGFNRWDNQVRSEQNPVFMEILEHVRRSR